MRKRPAPRKPAPRSTRTPRRSARRAAELRDHLTFLLEAANPSFVYFLETRNRGVFLRAAPIDVSGIISEMLFDRMRATILTSATLDRRRLVRLREGPPRRRTTPTACASRRSSTSAEQAILYLPRQMPPPKSPQYSDAVAREVRRPAAADRGPRVRAVHELRDAAHGARSGRAGPAVSRDRAGHGAAQRAARAVPQRRPTPCCLRPRRSGRALTSSASS